MRGKIRVRAQPNRPYFPSEWPSSHPSDKITWATQTTNTLVYHQITLQTPHPMTEVSNQVEDGTLFFAMPAVRRVHINSYQLACVADAVSCAGVFPKLHGQHRSHYSGHVRAKRDHDEPDHGAATYHWRVRLSLTKVSFVSSYPSYPYAHLNVHYCAPRSPFPVFAISANLGTIAATAAPLVWMMGMTREPAITYTGASGTPQSRSPYWASQFNEPLDAVRPRSTLLVISAPLTPAPTRSSISSQTTRTRSPERQRWT